MEVQLKTLVNTRAPLADRLPKPRSGAPVVVSATSLGLHRPLETTYDTHYLCHQPASSTTASNEGRQTHATTTDEGTTVTAASDMGATLDASEDGDRTRSYCIAAAPSSAWESESHAATRVVQPQRSLDFYSRVRRLERVEDDRRGVLPGNVQRTVDIRRKRAEDARLRPPSAGDYIQAEPVRLSDLARREKGEAVTLNYLDLVRCTHLGTNAEYMHGFDVAPTSRLPGLDLPQDLQTQSKAITHMATSKELFRGSAKYTENRPSGYMGHVPMADRNLAAMRQTSEDDPRRGFAKSYMTLAVHGGGVDAAVSGNNLRARHRAGKNARAPQALKPKSEASVAKMVEGSMLLTTLRDVTEGERQMNVRDDKRGERYF